MMALAKASAYHGKIYDHYHMTVIPTLYVTRVKKFAIILKQALTCSLGIISETLLCLQQHVKTKGISIKHLFQLAVSNRWTGLWTGSVEWIAGQDYWIQPNYQYKR